MKPSSKKRNKDKVIDIIQGFFDTKFIEKIASATKFVQRESKVQGANFFFYVCLQPSKREY